MPTLRDKDLKPQNHLNANISIPCILYHPCSCSICHAQQTLFFYTELLLGWLSKTSSFFKRMGDSVFSVITHFSSWGKNTKKLNDFCQIASYEWVNRLVYLEQLWALFHSSELCLYLNKLRQKAGSWWLMPVILATQEDCSSKPGK
jgi:hypothetical protein